MDTRYIQEFLQFAKTLNLTQAANDCYISKATLSAHLDQLAIELGSPLVERTNEGKWRLTFAGRKFQSSANEILDVVQRVVNDCHCTEITIVTNEVTAFDPKITIARNRFEEKYPERQIALTIKNTMPNQALELVKNNEADIGMFGIIQTGDDHIAPEIDDSLSCFYFSTLHDINFLIPYGSPLYTKDKIFSSDLDGETILSLEQGDISDQSMNAWVSAFKKTGVTINLRSTQAESLADFYINEAGDSLKIATDIAIQRLSLDSYEGFRIVKLEDFPFSFDAFIIHRKEPRDENVSLFLDELHAIAQ